MNRVTSAQANSFVFVFPLLPFFCWCCSCGLVNYFNCIQHELTLLSPSYFIRFIRTIYRFIFYFLHHRLYSKMFYTILRYINIVAQIKQVACIPHIYSILQQQQYKRNIRYYGKMTNQCDKEIERKQRQNIK